MVRQCFKCKKLDFLNPNLAFHRFPRDPDKRKMWINILSLETQGVPKVCVICSDHFDESDFIYNARGVCVLKDDNVLPKYDSSQDQLIESGVKTEEIKIENSETVKNIESVGDLNILDNCTIKNEILEDCTITKNTMVNEHKEIKEENESYHDQPDLVHVKFENSETTNEVEKMDESALDEIAIKNEEVLLKEEGEEAAKSSTSAMYEDKEKKAIEECHQSKLMEFEKNSCGEYQCSECSSKTKIYTSLKQHFRRKHSKSRIHKCNDCDFQSIYGNSFRDHVLRHKNRDEIGSFKCHICDFQINNHSDLMKHFLHQHSEEVVVYQCYECDYQTNHKFLLEPHVLRHKNIEEICMYKCNECPYESTYKTNLNRHRWRHINSKEVFKCHFCDFTTYESRPLMKHIVDQHPGLPKFKCKECDFQTKYKFSMNKHTARHLGIFKCHICKFTTTTHSDLLMHFGSQHPQEVKVHKCSECDFQTTFKVDFTRHILLHEKVLIYRCNECDYHTKNRSNFRRHLTLRHKC